MRDTANARLTNISSIALTYNIPINVVPTVGIRISKQAEENMRASIGDCRMMKLYRLILCHWKVKRLFSGRKSRLENAVSFLALRSVTFWDDARLGKCKEGNQKVYSSEHYAERQWHKYCNSVNGIWFPIVLSFVLLPSKHCYGFSQTSILPGNCSPESKSRSSSMEHQVKPSFQLSMPRTLYGD